MNPFERSCLYARAGKLTNDEVVLGVLEYDTTWKHVVRVEATSKKGRSCDVFVRRLPAMFFRVTSGDIELITGSGSQVAGHVERLTVAIAAGRLRFTCRSDGVMVEDIELRGDPKVVDEFEDLAGRNMIGFRTGEHG